ncbi:helix-turn-helix transcriptional regulator [Stappia sp. ES.058]|uniref:AraC family transcriptional regulator n=1 Tax=Stappia sp. ES.058 TaxID=1881061 RepID=UPI00087A734F|nr:helix-turn-helix transcriptional regulator [Stappia sp. ES.058]SDU43142.1 AraC-like ligand binding domain-containing protein [Stappia sp. ES.058]
MWTYFRNPLIELGIPTETARKPLRPHVHTNVQVMVVTKGSRRVNLARQAVNVLTNSILIIPPGVVHLADQDDWEGFNAYIDPSVRYNWIASILRYPSLPDWVCDMSKNGPSFDLPALLSLISEGRLVWADPKLSKYRYDHHEMPDWPQSREGHIRRYKREAGISPHAHFKATQLDQARSKIANGETLASVAAELGFTDQSHLGRQFRASFGISPGRYAKG